LGDKFFPVKGFVLKLGRFPPRVDEGGKRSPAVPERVLFGLIGGGEDGE